MKVFGIGLNKTGTTSLGACLERLGYRTKGCSKKLTRGLLLDGNYEDTNYTVENYDAFQDWPWPLIYQYLDKNWPGSKFVLTLRKDPEKWLKSLKRHSLIASPMPWDRRYAYGHYYAFWS